MDVLWCLAAMAICVIGYLAVAFCRVLLLDPMPGGMIGRLDEADIVVNGHGGPE
jgi:hypothetical protein